MYCVYPYIQYTFNIQFKKKGEKGKQGEKKGKEKEKKEKREEKTISNQKKHNNSFLSLGEGNSNAISFPLFLNSNIITFPCYKNKPGTRGRLRKELQNPVDGLTGLMGLTH